MIGVEHYQELMDRMRECCRTSAFKNMSYIGIPTGTLTQELQDKLNSNVAIMAEHDRVGVNLKLTRLLTEKHEKYWFIPRG
jgi:hypothetical protein